MTMNGQVCRLGVTSVMPTGTGGSCSASSGAETTVERREEVRITQKATNIKCIRCRPFRVSQGREETEDAAVGNRAMRLFLVHGDLLLVLALLLDAGTVQSDTHILS